MTDRDTAQQDERAYEQHESRHGGQEDALRRLPQPGERHNASSIPVSDLALSALLAQAQIANRLLDCQIEDCENCNAHRLIWWDCCNALDRSTRVTLQSWLKSEGYGLPETPWEDLEQVDREGGIGYESVEE